MTSASNCRHLRRETEGVSRSIELAYQITPPKLQHFRKSNAFEAASQESAVLKCRAVRHRTSSLTSRPIDPLPFSSLIPRCIPYDLPFKKEGDGLARQLFRNRH